MIIHFLVIIGGPVLQDEIDRTNNVLPEIREKPNDDAPLDPPLLPYVP